MLGIAAPIWNQISPLCKHPQWQRLMAMESEAMHQARDRVFHQLQAEGVEAVVAAAFLDVAPLLHERQAVATFSRQNPQYREALTEVLSTNEAILLMVKDHHLRVSQTRELRKLLDGNPPTF